MQRKGGSGGRGSGSLKEILGTRGCLGNRARGNSNVSLPTGSTAAHFAGADMLMCWWFGVVGKGYEILQCFEMDIVRFGPGVYI